jgi:hypothetical protein
VVFCFFHEALLVREGGGGRLQDKRICSSLDRLSSTGYFLFSKPEWVRGLKSCMRKNLFPLQIKKFPDRP